MDYLDDFSAHLISCDRSTQTVLGYTNDVALFVRWYEETYGCPFKPEELTNAAIQAYKQTMIQRGAKPRSINRRVASLAAFGLWAQIAGHMGPGPNPAVGIRTVKQVEYAPRWLDNRECAKLLRVIDDQIRRAMTRYPRLHIIIVRDATITKLILNSGIRVSELAALRLNDVCLENNRGNLVVRAGKGTKRREIPLNAEARQAIKIYLQLRPNLPVDALFIGQSGEGIDTRTVQRSVSRFASLAGLSGVSCHTLRHTFAKSLVDHGVSIEKVAMLLGHSSLNTTLIYTTPGRRDLEQAVDTLAAENNSKA